MTGTERGRQISKFAGTSEDEDGEDVDVPRRHDLGYECYGYETAFRFLLGPDDISEPSNT